MASNNYLTYSPSCEAYIATKDSSGADSYYDVTKDITDLSITLQTDDASNFALRLANKNRKYDGLFSAMDRVSLFATKTERYQLFTGYITSVTVLQIYAGEIVITGKCPIYRLQNLYWDPGSEASHLLFAEDKFKWDNNASKAIYALLMEVGGMPQENILLGKIPPSVLSWAKKMYMTQKEDMKQAVNVVESFEKMLGEHGPKFGGGVGGGAVSGDVDVTDKRAVFNFMVEKLGWTKACACGAMGAWEAESGIDPTGVEGIYSEPHQLGPKKQAAMKDWQSYTIGTLFPMYAGRLSINQAAYKGRDGKFYPGIGLAQWTGPRATDYLDFCKANNMKWYNMDAALSMVTHEIKTVYTSLDTPAFTGLTDPAEACSMFVRVYEHAGYGSDPTRISNAKRFYSEFA